MLSRLHRGLRFLPVPSAHVVRYGLSGGCVAALMVPVHSSLWTDGRVFDRPMGLPCVSFGQTFVQRICPFSWALCPLQFVADGARSG